MMPALLILAAMVLSESVLRLMATLVPLICTVPDAALPDVTPSALATDCVALLRLIEPAPVVRRCRA